MRRKRLRNGLIVVAIGGNWWIGVRRDYGAVGYEVCLLGLMLFIPDEYWARRS